MIESSIKWLKDNDQVLVQIILKVFWYIIFLLLAYLANDIC